MIVLSERHEQTVIVVAIIIDVVAITRINPYTTLSPCQMPVFDAMGLVVCCAETFSCPPRTPGIVSCEPDDLTITLEGKDVGGNSVRTSGRG